MKVFDKITDRVCSLFERIVPLLTLFFAATSSWFLIKKSVGYCFYVLLCTNTLFWWSYFVTVFKKASYLPHNRDPIRHRFLESQLQVFQYQRHEMKSNGCRRFCRKCVAFKPDRCHHCHVSKRCVIMYDHYCQFLGCVIAFHNQKQFVVCLFWWSVSLLLGFYHVYNPSGYNDSYLLLIGIRPTGAFEFFACITCLCIGLVVFIFLGLTMLVYSKGCTTFEMIYKFNVKICGAELPNYNLGIRENLNGIFGSNPLFWFLPISTRRDGDIGYEFKIYDKNSDVSFDKYFEYERKFK